MMRIQDILAEYAAQVETTREELESLQGFIDVLIDAEFCSQCHERHDDCDCVSYAEELAGK